MLGGRKTNWLFTENQTFIVPFTGRYYLELHGGVGGGIVGSLYGCGGAEAASSTTGNKDPTAGCVYLKYLGE